MSAKQCCSFSRNEIAPHRLVSSPRLLSAVVFLGLLLSGGFSAASSTAAKIAKTSTVGISASVSVCPVSIGFGETIQCSISAAGEIDTYTFTASPGDSVLIRMTAISGSLWPGIQVYDPDGALLCEGSFLLTAQIDGCMLAVGGTYSIKVFDHFSGTYTGDYYLYLQRMNNPANAVSISFGQTLSGSILSPAQMNTYTFTASPGDIVLARMIAVSGSLWPGIRMYDPDGVLVCDDTTPPTGQIASCTLAAGGTYSVFAFDGSGLGYTGDYYLYLQRLNNPSNAVPISFGQTLSGSILSPAQMNTYTFTASPGDIVLVRATSFKLRWDYLWPGIRVYDPSGVKLCEASNTAGTAEITSCVLHAGGTYSVLVFDYPYATKTGDYYLYLQQAGVPTPVSPNGTISDTTPTYTWSKVSEATQYRYELWKGTTTVYTKTVAASVCGASTCAHTPTTVLSYAAYKWRVQTLVGGAWSSYSAYRNFTITNLPIPKSPSGAITDTTPTFTWTKVSGATQYQFVVYKGTALKYTKTVASGACGAKATNCSNTPTTVLSLGAHTWKVRAFVGGAWRAYSAAKAFSVSKPRAGFWESPAGVEFYVTPNQANVRGFAIYVSVSGCGSYKITHSTLVPISNNHFSFSGPFYGSGSFVTPKKATGRAGLSSFPISGCGSVSGGPWTYTDAIWRDSSQPSIVSAAINLVEILGIGDLGLPNPYYIAEVVAP